MVRYCCVPNCKTRQGKGVSFHAFPNEQDLRKAWIVNLRMRKAVSKSMTVCNKHFANEDYLQLDGYTYCRLRLKKSAIPSVNLPKSLHQSPNKIVTQEKQQHTITTNISSSPNNMVDNAVKEVELATVKIEKDADTANNSSAPEETMEMLQKEEEIVALKAELSTKNDDLEMLQSLLKVKNEECERMQLQIEEQDRKMAAMAASISADQNNITALKSRNANGHLELQKSKLKIQKLTKDISNISNMLFSMESLKKDDALLQYYTGISSYTQFTTLVNYLVPDNDTTQINYGVLSPQYLPLEDQMLTVLTKLKQNFSFKDLAFRLGKSTSGISRLFNVWINFMYLRLGPLCLWPHRDVLIANSPQDFLTTFPNVMVVIDGTELLTQKPCEGRLRYDEMHTTGKNSNTLKGLIGVDQCGGLVFISPLMDGSISNQDIFRESGLMSVIQDKIQNGELLISDEIMADKAFKIQDILNDVHMSQADVLAPKNLARFRVNVKKTMARIKQFKILSGVIPISFLGSINQIWTVSCFLANIQLSLLSK